MAQGTLQQPVPPAHRPAATRATASDRIKAGVIAVILIGLCLATWVAPDLLHIDTSDMTGRKGRGLAHVINLIWSRPVGTLLGVIGLLAMWGVLMNSPQGGATDDTHAA